MSTYASILAESPFPGFSYLSTFSKTIFNVGFCVTNVLRPYMPKNIFIIPSHLNKNLVGYKSRLKVLLDFQYFKMLPLSSWQ